MIEMPETNQTNIFTTHIIPDNEDDRSFQPKDPVEPPLPAKDSTDEILVTNSDAVVTTPPTTVIDMDPITHVIPEDPEPKFLDPQDELLRWHYRLGHLPFDRIKQLANKGQLPKRLLTCHTPFCAATSTPWEPTENKQPARQHQDPPMPSINDADETNPPAPQQPMAPAAPPLPQPEPPPATARQTRSGRVSLRSKCFAS